MGREVIAPDPSATPVDPRAASGPTIADEPAPSEHAAEGWETAEPTTALPASTPPVDVLYIAGAHRSGATPLGAILGGEAGIFYAGELYRFPHPIFDRPTAQRLCSCGVRVDRCLFWTAVKDRLDAEPGFLDELRAGQLKFERWRSLPLTLLRWAWGDPELREHARRMGRMVRVLAGLSRSGVIVESSYNPLRGLLYRIPEAGVRVRYLHLVRDGRNFVFSERTATDRPEVRWRWLRATPVIVGRWIVSHLLTVLLLRRGGRYVRLRYEEFARLPGSSLWKIASLLERDLSETIGRVNEGIPIPMRHIAAGNRMRTRGWIVLRPELARVPALRAGARATFWGLGGWLALLFGYRPGRSSRPSS
jgi:hypothetical protein